jgi:hypothetical protein
MDRRQVELGIADVLDTVRRDERARGLRRSHATPKKGRPAPPRTGTRRRDGRRERSTKKGRR